MLRRCPGLFIQVSTTSATESCPSAMFSPIDRQSQPAAFERSRTVVPSGLLCSKYAPPQHVLGVRLRRAVELGRASAASVLSLLGGGGCR